jgi:periplasmic protein CpxP/Spy
MSAVNRSIEIRKERISVKPITVLIALTVLVTGFMVDSGLAFQNQPVPERSVELQGPPPDAFDGLSPDPFDGSSADAFDDSPAAAFDGPPPRPFGPTLAAFDGPPPGHPGPPPGGFGPHPDGIGPPEMAHGKKPMRPEPLPKILGLTDQQLKDMRVQRAGFQDRTRKARTSIDSLRDEKETMILAGKIDQDKLTKLDEEMLKFRTEVMKEKLKLRRDWLAMLTPEQLDKFADFMSKRGSKPFHAGMPGHGKRPHHP